MLNLENELSELSHYELQYVIDSYFFWDYETMSREELISDLGKLGGEPISHILKVIPKIMVEEQIEKMRELIAKAKRLRIR